MNFGVILLRLLERKLSNNIAGEIMVKYSSTLLIIFSILLVGCSKKSDNELMESADRNIQNGDFTEAVEDFETLINEHPGSLLAPKAFFEIGKIYQGQMIKNASRVQSFETAIKNYKSIYEKFPDDVNAPSALFMIAFIQANELNRLEDAQATYKLFIEKYPEHELAASAQAEIDNLGLTPEEILKRKMNSAQQ